MNKVVQNSRTSTDSLAVLRCAALKSVKYQKQSSSFKSSRFRGTLPKRHFSNDTKHETLASTSSKRSRSNSSQLKTSATRHIEPSVPENSVLLQDGNSRNQRQPISKKTDKPSRSVDDENSPISEEHCTMPLIHNSVSRSDASDTSDDDEVRTIDAVHSSCDEDALSSDLRHSESSDEFDVVKLSPHLSLPDDDQTSVSTVDAIESDDNDYVPPHIDNEDEEKIDKIITLTNHDRVETKVNTDSRQKAAPIKKVPRKLIDDDDDWFFKLMPIRPMFDIELLDMDEAECKAAMKNQQVEKPGDQIASVHYESEMPIEATELSETGSKKAAPSSDNGYSLLVSSPQLQNDESVRTTFQSTTKTGRNKVKNVPVSNSETLPTKKLSGLKEVARKRKNRSRSRSKPRRKHRPSKSRDKKKHRHRHHCSSTTSTSSLSRSSSTFSTTSTGSSSTSTKRKRQRHRKSRSRDRSLRKSHHNGRSHRRRSSSSHRRHFSQHSSTRRTIESPLTPRPAKYRPDALKPSPAVPVRPTLLPKPASPPVTSFFDKQLKPLVETVSAKKIGSTTPTLQLKSIVVAPGTKLSSKKTECKPMSSKVTPPLVKTILQDEELGGNATKQSQKKVISPVKVVSQLKTLVTDWKQSSKRTESAKVAVKNMDELVPPENVNLEPLSKVVLKPKVLITAVNQSPKKMGSVKVAVGITDELVSPQKTDLEPSSKVVLKPKALTTKQPIKKTKLAESFVENVNELMSSKEVDLKPYSKVVSKPKVLLTAAKQSPKKTESVKVAVIGNANELVPSKKVPLTPKKVVSQPKVPITAPKQSPKKMGSVKVAAETTDKLVSPRKVDLEPFSKVVLEPKEPITAVKQSPKKKELVKVAVIENVNELMASKNIYSTPIQVVSQRKAPEEATTKQSLTKTEFAEVSVANLGEVMPSKKVTEKSPSSLKAKIEQSLTTTTPQAIVTVEPKEPINDFPQQQQRIVIDVQDTTTNEEAAESKNQPATNRSPVRKPKSRLVAAEVCVKWSKKQKGAPAAAPATPIPMEEECASSKATNLNCDLAKVAATSLKVKLRRPSIL